MKKLNGYQVQLVADRIWAIDEFGTDIIYLAEGSEKAMLVDTGAGLGKLKDTVRQLTDKPYFVVNTHGHLDHASGNGAFDEVYMNERDFWMVDGSYLNEEKWSSFCRKTMKEQGYSGPSLESIPLPSVPVPYPLPAARRFELGDRSFEVLELPGHTPGSIALLDTLNRVLIAGDSVVSTPVLIFDTYSTTVKAYKEGLERLVQREAEFDIILPGHYLRPIGKRYLFDLYSCARAIVEGRARPEVMDMSHMSEESALIYQYNLGEIIYNEKHIV